MVIFGLSVFLHKPPVKLSICKNIHIICIFRTIQALLAQTLGVLTVSCGAALEYTEKQPRKYSAKPYEGMRAMNNDTEKGYLKISVTEVGGTIPIKGALVVITEYGDDDGESVNVLYSLTTDESGYTPTLALDAPVKSESMMPGAYQPYALYNINVVFDRYYPVESVGVPVFAGVTSIQPINLLPLSEKAFIAGADNGRIMIYETPGMNALSPDGVVRDEIGNRNGTVSGGVIQEGRQ